MRSGGIFDLPAKQLRLEEIARTLADPAIWQMPDKTQPLNQERVQLEATVSTFSELYRKLCDAKELLALIVAEQDKEALSLCEEEVKALARAVAQQEFYRMFSEATDVHSAYLEIQAGSGGTEAQDWANMLLRMYLRWADAHGFKTHMLACSDGEVAGIKSATVQVVGAYAYGWLRTETGVHRLVRKSPFDSGNRRHTSFASVFVSPEIDDNIDIVIDPADLRIDTYRSSGAGGQHVNTTDSAIRITHIPTGIVVQCQNERSQHKNKAQALKQLHAKLYTMERQKQMADKASQAASKLEISWGSQIRSYVLDDSRIKDLRTKVETTHTQAVLDGGIDLFLEASLRAGE